MKNSLIAAKFEGPILFRGLSIEEASGDFGHIYYNKLAAVFSPASVEHISNLIRRVALFPNLTIAARGNGHSTNG